MLDPKRIGEYISQLRKERGLTQSALAELLCVTHQAVSKWERGAALPDVEVLVAIRRVFGVSVDDILNAGQTVDQTPEAAPAGPQGKDSIDTITAKHIIIYGSRTFESAVSVDECIIFGGVHCKADLRANNLEIHGSGEFDKSVMADIITVGGRARIRGRIAADTMNACGMLSVAGGITCDTLESPGRTHCGGAVKCDSFRNSGAFNLGGGIVADAMFNSGSLNLGGGIACDSLNNSGVLSAGGGVACDGFVSAGECSLGGGIAADTVALSGVFRFGGTIVARSVSVMLSGQECRADGIEAEDLEVSRAEGHAATLSVRKITVQLGKLEHVHAEQANIKTGKIGDGCKIAHLECGASVDIAPGAQVDEVVRLEGQADPVR